MNKKEKRLAVRQAVQNTVLRDELKRSMRQHTPFVRCWPHCPLRRAVWMRHKWKKIEPVTVTIR